MSERHHDGTDTRDEGESEGESSTGSDGVIDEPDDPFEAFDDLEEIEETEVTPEEIDRLFEPVDTAEIDEEAVWDTIFGEGDPSGETSETDGVDAIVPKNQYCNRCEYFSEPPETACTYPESEIVELVGVDRFRVSNCPVVAQRQRAKTIFPIDR